MELRGNHVRDVVERRGKSLKSLISQGDLISSSDGLAFLLVFIWFVRYYLVLKVGGCLTKITDCAIMFTDKTLPVYFRFCYVNLVLNV